MLPLPCSFHRRRTLKKQCLLPFIIFASQTYIYIWNLFDRISFHLRVHLENRTTDVVWENISVGVEIRVIQCDKQGTILHPPHSWKTRCKVTLIELTFLHFFLALLQGIFIGLADSVGAKMAAGLEPTHSKTTSSTSFNKQLLECEVPSESILGKVSGEKWKPSVILSERSKKI